ncbi:MAG: hypothetical protein RIB45_08455 [Marivibrio sp.]|uniref:hypothetical protein n=1 Tax=Marivibrio sp. TaxID=2039719 RepID=UPI0032F0950D
MRFQKEDVAAGLGALAGVATGQYAYWTAAEEVRLLWALLLVPAALLLGALLGVILSALLEQALQAGLRGRAGLLCAAFLSLVVFYGLHSIVLHVN